MVIEQGDEPVGVAVPTLERVVVVEHAQRLVLVQAWTREPIAKTLVIDEGRAQGCAQGEIEYRIEVVVILVLQELVDVILTLEQHFANETNAGVLTADLGLEVVPELRLHMFDSIHADVGDFTLVDPRFDVLNKIVEDLRVIVIEVRQARQLTFDITGSSHVEPIGAEPPVCSIAHVVDHHVQHDLHALTFALVNERFEGAHFRRGGQLGAIEQAGVDPVEILWPVVMVGFRCSESLDVLIDRCYPDCRHAKLEEVVELLDDSIERTSVDARVRCVDGPLVCTEEAIRHHKVDDVILGNLLVHGFSSWSYLSRFPQSKVEVGPESPTIPRSSRIRAIETIQNPDAAISPPKSIELKGWEFRLPGSNWPTNWCLRLGR